MGSGHCWSLREMENPYDYSVTDLLEGQAYCQTSNISRTLVGNKILLTQM